MKRVTQVFVSAGITKVESIKLTENVVQQLTTHPDDIVEIQFTYRRAPLTIRISDGEVGWSTKSGPTFSVVSFDSRDMIDSLSNFLTYCNPQPFYY